MFQFLRVHRIKVDKKYFSLFANGEKTMVFMLANRKRKKIKDGDKLIIKSSEEKLNFVVVRVSKADNFEELFKLVDIAKSGFKNEKSILENLHNVFSAKKRNNFSAIAVEFE